MAMNNKSNGKRGAWGFLVLLVALLAVVIVARQTAQAQAARPNVIFIMVDALRADHVSAYGYERPTTPNLDAFMAGGARFAEATTPSSWTFPSNASMLTGRMPRRLRMNDWASLSAAVQPEELLLAEALRNGGYRTVGFVNNFFLDQQFGFAQGFEHYERLVSSEMAADLNAMAFIWLDANRPTLGNQPLFLFMYYYDPHTWYDPPPPYDTLYDPNYTGPLTPDVYQHGYDVVSGAIAPKARDVRHLLALYDGEITYWDHHLGQFLSRLAAEGLLNNSLVIVTSDHGQMFGEHDKWVHRNSLYEEVLRVPLFIYFPSVAPAGATIETPIFTADLMPTILDLVGLPVPPRLDGKSLRPLLEGKPGALAGRPIYAEMESETNPNSLGYWIAPRYDLRSMKADGWKYVLEVNNPAGDALYKVRPNSLYEAANAIADYPQKANTLHKGIYDWFLIPTEFNFLPSVRFH
jgi:arylsulfatase A-like enzyme